MNSMVNEADLRIAPCLRDGPISENARAFVEAARNLRVSAAASTLRAWCVPSLFNQMERVLRSDEEPLSGLNHALASLSHLLRTMAASGLDNWNPGNENWPPEP